jgi:hypothetical protein
MILTLILLANGLVSEKSDVAIINPMTLLSYKQKPFLDFNSKLRGAVEINPEQLCQHDWMILEKTIKGTDSKSIKSIFHKSQLEYREYKIVGVKDINDTEVTIDEKEISRGVDCFSTHSEL